MVHDKKNTKEEWENDPKHRNKSNSDVISCEGRMEGFFLEGHVLVSNKTLSHVQQRERRDYENECRPSTKNTHDLAGTNVEYFVRE
jgi:hypothetical protein